MKVKNMNLNVIKSSILIMNLVMGLSYKSLASSEPTNKYPQSRITYKETFNGKIKSDNIKCILNNSYTGSSLNGATLDSSNIVTPKAINFPKTLQSISFKDDCTELKSFLEKTSENEISYTASYTVKEHVELNIVNGKENCTKYTDQKMFSITLLKDNKEVENELFNFASLSKEFDGKKGQTVIVDVDADQVCNLNLF